MKSSPFVLFVASLVATLAPLTSAAQAPDDQGANGQGPMIVERVHSGFLAAPDIKITEVDRRTSELAGGYAGWITDDTFFVGAGGYWLVNPANDRKMGYGGLVLQWLVRGREPIGVSVKG